METKISKRNAKIDNTARSKQKIPIILENLKYFIMNTKKTKKTKAYFF